MKFTRLSTATEMLAAVLVIALAGCGSTEALRRTVYYDGEAAKSIESRFGRIAADPAATEPIKAEALAGREEAVNIRASVPLIQSEVGEPDPKTTPPYNPAEHAKANDDAKKELENKAGLLDGIWNFAQTGAGKLTAALGLGTVGAMVVGWFRTASKAAKLWEYAKLAGGIFEKSQDLKDQFADKAAKKGIPKIVDEVVQMLPK